MGADADACRLSLASSCRRCGTSTLILALVSRREPPGHQLVLGFAQKVLRPTHESAVVSAGGRVWVGVGGGCAPLADSEPED